MNVIDQVFGSIHNFFEKLVNKIKGIPEIVYKACNTLYPIFKSIYADLSSGTANLIVQLIPGTMDDQVRNDLLLAIDAALSALGYVQGVLQDKYAAFITDNASKTVFAQQAMLVKALSLSAFHLNGATDHISTYDTAAQNTVYTHITAAA